MSGKIPSFHVMASMPVEEFAAIAPLIPRYDYIGAVRARLAHLQGVGSVPIYTRTEEAFEHACLVVHRIHVWRHEQARKGGAS